MHSPFYDIYASYDENYKKGPLGLKKLKKPKFKLENSQYKFLGFPINLPFGIPAGPLLNSKFIKGAFDFGFSVSIYKTVRADIFPCHPYPNILYVNAPLELHPNKNPRLIAGSTLKTKKINITNSFGVPSKKSKVWQKDVKRAKRFEKKGQLLILSFMGTVKKNQTQEEFIKDFAKAAKLANATGVKALEANLSCPNIGNEGLVCYNLDVTEKVCKEIRKVIGKTPLILKVGYYKNPKDLEKLAKIANKYANAVSSINTLQVEVIDKKGNQALPGHNRLRSGVCGDTIRWAGLEMVKKLNRIRKAKGYKFEIIGVGGVTTVKDYSDYRKAGADLVQSATGAMWNPYLAQQIFEQTGKMTFRQKLEKAIRKNNSLLCVGLDNGDFNFNKKIIDQTHDLVCAYKPQIAFYESKGIKGIKNLKSTVQYIHKKAPGLPVICDAKRGDIGSTSKQYAISLFENYGFDAITVNPYLGFDAIEPFLKYKDKGVIILCRTSNPGASDFQDLSVNGQPLYVHVAKKVLEWNKKYENCLMVVGATWPDQLKQIRKVAPKMTFLVPGIGAQGGDLKKTLEAGLTNERSGLIINSSRGIIFAENPRAAAIELRDAINKYRWYKGNGISEKVAKILLEIKAISLRPQKPYRYASGILSPVYTDCRILMAYPKHRKLIRDLYVKNLKSNGRVQLIAATATAGIPHGAWVSDKMNLPMVYVRGSAKDHGKGNQIEGVVKRGQKAAVIEDLISTGSSSTTTADAVRKAGGDVSHIFSIFTYGMKVADENFKKNNLELTTLTDFETVVEVAEKIGYINHKDKEVVLKWTEDPASWGKKMGFE